MIILVGSHNAQEAWCHKNLDGFTLDYCVNTKKVVSISHTRHLTRLNNMAFPRRKNISLVEVGSGLLELKKLAREAIAAKPL